MIINATMLRHIATEIAMLGTFQDDEALEEVCDQATIAIMNVVNLLDIKAEQEQEG